MLVVVAFRAAEHGEKSCNMLKVCGAKLQTVHHTTFCLTAKR